MCSAVCTKRKTFVLEKDHETVELSKYLQHLLRKRVSSLISLTFHTFTGDTDTLILHYIMHGHVC